MRTEAMKEEKHALADCEVGRGECLRPQRCDAALCMCLDAFGNQDPSDSGETELLEIR